MTIWKISIKKREKVATIRMLKMRIHSRSICFKKLGHYSTATQKRLIIIIKYFRHV